MKSYNGFTAATRNRAQHWLRTEWQAGRLERPKVCCACGQDKGVIDAHAEDYSEPFARGKTDEFHLCFACHMMVHCRFRARDQWDRYKSAVASGGRSVPFMSRDFGRFAAAFLDGPDLFKTAMPLHVKFPRRERDVLLEIERSQDRYRDSK